MQGSLCFFSNISSGFSKGGRRETVLLLYFFCKNIILPYFLELHIIFSAGQRRKSTSNEELEKLVICTDKVEEKRFEFLEKEHIVKKPEICQVDTKEDSDVERLCLDIDFKAMQKINKPGSSKVVYGEGIEDDENDVLFFQEFSKYSKRKLSKLRTVEHSDGDQSSGSSVDENQKRKFVDPFPS